MSYYDENFGHWEGMSNPENVAFYHKVQRRSVLTTCRQCGQKVRLLPGYDLCGRCADLNEHGFGC